MSQCIRTYAGNRLRSHRPSLSKAGAVIALVSPGPHVPVGFVIPIGEGPISNPLWLSDNV